MAIFALIDPLSAAEQDLAGLLDTALQGSLWDRTLRRAEDFRDLGRALLDSRAKWLWRVTSESQRSACFASGLGHASGVFLYERLDSLVAELAAMHEAVADQRASDVVAPALRFAEVVMEDAFFSVNLPTAWRSGLTKWVSGTAFAEIIEEDSKLQPFIQDGVVFRLVWAAEAVRVQAASTEHPRAGELGEGPALVLTHGVPTIQAALLCQAGLASRTASVHATQERPSDFTDFSGLWQWVNDNADDLYDSAFWATEDQFLLWRSVESGPTGERSREWERREVKAQPTWEAKRPKKGTRIRLIPEFGRSAFVCSEQLDLLGKVEFEEDLSETHLTGQVTGKGHIKVSCFGPGKRD